MRRQPTGAEAALWKLLRNGRLQSHKFKRQQPAGEFIVDFVCLASRIIVEVDGGQHSHSVDAARTAWLETQGFLIVRFWNNEVLTNIEGVYETISRALRDNPSPQPLSRKGRGAESAKLSRLTGEGAKPPRLTGQGAKPPRLTREGAKPALVKGEGAKPAPARGEGAKPLPLDGGGVGERVNPKPIARGLLATSSKQVKTG